MIRQVFLIALAAAFIVACAAPVHAITCQECQDIGSKTASLEQEIAQKEQEIQKAFEQKKYQGIAEIRRQVTDLRRNLNDLQKKEMGCKDACKPDVVKGDECARIRSEILKLEETSTSDTDAEPLNKLYRDLAKCHKDLGQMKKTP